jgi:heptosyltransferase II
VQNRASIFALLPNWLGDAAMATPALRALRGHFPDATLTVAGRAGACGLLQGLPWIDRFYTLPAKPSALAMSRIARELAPAAADLAVVFPHSIRAALLAYLTHSHKRVGYARGRRSWLFTHPVPPYQENGRTAPIYMAREYLELVATLGCRDDGCGLELACDPQVRDQVRARMPQGRPVVGIAPGGAFGPSKRWMPERFAQVADQLTADGAQCVLITGPGEEGIRDAVRNAARAPLHVVDDGRPTIETLKATISQLDLLVGNDSGPRHVAVACKVPVICIMGPTSPRYSEGPYEKGKVLRINVDCGPCQQPTCRTDHRCMTGISAEKVVTAARQFLLNHE